MTAALADAPKFVDGESFRKEDAYRGAKAGELRQITQGVYLPSSVSIRDAFQTYGMRIAKKFFPNAVLTHSTALYLSARHDRIFIGGDYPYKKKIMDLHEDGSVYEARIVQSKVFPKLDDKRLYEPVTVSDPLGKMEFYRATTELQLLQQMEATKINPEKHVSEDELMRMWSTLVLKHNGRGEALDALHKSAIAANRENEIKRFFARVSYLDGI